MTKTQDLAEWILLGVLALADALWIGALIARL